MDQTYSIATRGLVYGLALTILAGCAGSNYRPMVDGRGVNSTKYESDLRDCQAYAEQLPGAGVGAGVGAIAGAVFGAALAAAAGRGYDRDATARVGALTGAVGGAASGETDQRDVIRRCMSGRGYSVLR